MIAFNQTSPQDVDGRMKAMNELFGKETHAWIEPPFYCCYGYNITLGEDSYVNFNCNFVNDIPANCVAVGNPCRVLREIGEKDETYYYKDWKITKEDLEEERKLRGGIVPHFNKRVIAFCRNVED